MIRRIFLMAVLAFATPLAAQSVKLKAHEIEILLSGNTAVGKWQGAPYRQFFGADGSTIYAQEGTRSTLGKWRIDAERDEYQSIWPRDTDWEGWYVMEYAGDFFWVSKNTPPTPFEVLEGQKLVVANTDAHPRCAVISDWSEGGAQELTALFGANKPEQCGESLGQSGATSRHCAWGYPYRMAQAQQDFKTLGALLQGCFEGAASGNGDQVVNHPDSYDLRMFQTENGALSMSLKDKGALQKTYIFLRAEGQLEE